MKLFNIRLLGWKTGVSKKTNKNFYTVNFSVKLDDYLADQTTGEEVATCSIPSDLYDRISKKKPGDVVKGIVTRSGFSLQIYDLEGV